MTIKTAIESAKAHSVWLTEQVNGLEIGHGDRGRLAAASLGIALDHYAGLIVLLDNGCYPSFTALLRSQLDAAMRGTWLAACATDEEVKAFTEDKVPSSSKILDVVEDAFGNGVIAQVKAFNWKVLCDFTHTGIRQLQRNVTDGAVEWNYPETELLDALTWAGGWASVSAAMLADVAGNKEVGQRLVDRAAEITARERAASCEKSSDGEVAAGGGPYPAETIEPGTCDE